MGEAIAELGWLLTIYVTLPMMLFLVAGLLLGMLRR